jgi:hypothetical protein
MQCNGPPICMCYSGRESGSAHGCLGDEYVTAVDGLCVWGGVPPPRWHPSTIPLALRKMMEEVGQVGSVPMPNQPTLRWKQHFKLWVSISVRAEGKHPYKPCYLGNITGSSTHLFWCPTLRQGWLVLTRIITGVIAEVITHNASHTRMLQMKCSES